MGSRGKQITSEVLVLQFLELILQIKHFCPKVPVLLVGCKKDLRSDPTELKNLEEAKLSPVSSADGQQVANKIGAVGYYECSAKTKV